MLSGNLPPNRLEYFRGERLRLGKGKLDPIEILYGWTPGQDAEQVADIGRRKPARTLSYVLLSGLTPPLSPCNIRSYTIEKSPSIC